MSETSNFIEFDHYFRNLWLDSKPLVKLFRTEAAGYIYDTGTNRILFCSDLEFNLLNNLFKYDIEEALNITSASCSPNEFLETFYKIKNEIEEKNILKTKRSIRFGGRHFNGLEESIRNALGMIQLEITERCNLRCGYCCYNPHFKEKRNHGTRDMSLDIALKAIDHLAESSRFKEDVAVTFYGGEPLLRFPFIKSCVKYARNRLKKKNLSFSITTNATLITSHITKFFSDEAFGVHVSIDGPQDIHDEYRKDIKGLGSFQRTILGLKDLYDAYSDKNYLISLSMVYAPPYSMEKIMRIAELWNYYPWLQSKTALNISYAQGFHMPQLDEGKKIDISLLEWAINNYIDNYRNGFQPHPIAANVVEKELARIVKRPIYAMPLGNYYLNGCCVPGARKQYISVDGTILMCERIGMAPSLGNVEAGINIERINDLYVNEYEKKCLASCSECWALQLCSICYVQAFSGDQIDIEKKNRNCFLMRKRILEFLILFCRLLEINKTGLDFLSDWIIR